MSLTGPLSYPDQFTPWSPSVIHACLLTDRDVRLYIADCLGLKRPIGLPMSGLRAQALGSALSANSKLAQLVARHQTRRTPGTVGRCPPIFILDDLAYFRCTSRPSSDEYINTLPLTPYGPGNPNPKHRNKPQE